MVKKEDFAIVVNKDWGTTPLRNEVIGTDGLPTYGRIEDRRIVCNGINRLQVSEKKQELIMHWVYRRAWYARNNSVLPPKPAQVNLRGLSSHGRISKEIEVV